MALPVLPRAQGPIAGQLPTNIEWYNFFRDLRTFVVDNDGDIAQIDEILARLTALENESFDPGTLLGPVSVQVMGSLADGIASVQFVNDELEPGNTYYYGTGPDGMKGWFTVRSALDFGDGIDLTTGSDGVTEISFNAATGEVASLPGATYKTVQKTIDVMFSPGVITGGEVTELTSTSVRITGGTAVVRVADDNVSELRFFDFPSQDFSVPDVQVTHFYALDYNGGSPTIVETTVTESWDRDTEIPLGSAVRGDGILNVTPNPYRVGDVITNLIQRLDAIGPVQRDNSVGGLALGEAGTRNVTVSAGRIWSRVSDFITAAKNSSVDTMLSVYYNGTNLTVTNGITQWDNQNYNDVGTGSLVALGNNKYANLWFFMSFNGDHYGFAYGTGEHNSLGDAANEGVPSYLTQNFFNQFILLGRFVFQESSATAGLIESAFATPFTSQAVNTHNNLGGLQGGTSGEFYHFTSAEHAGLLQWSSETPSDYALITQSITNGDTTHSPSGDAVFDALAGKQPLDATLTALAAQDWAANAFPIGTGADTVSQVAFAANTFPARASTGTLGAKSILDGSLSVLAGTSGTSTFLRGDGTASDTLTGNLSVTGGRLGVGVAAGAESILIDTDNNTAASGDPSFLMRGTNGKNRAEVRAYGAGNVAVFQMGLARGTVASPTAVQSGDILGAMAGRGFDGSVFSPSRVTFLFRAAENWTGSAQGTTCAIETALIGTTTTAARIFIDGTANIGFRTTTQFGGGAGVIGVANATTVPTSNPTGGGILYSEAGAGKWRGSSGTITTFGPAEPHCAHCKADFVNEWENVPRYGYLAVCMRCLVRGRISWAEQKWKWHSHPIPVFLAICAFRALQRRWLRWRYNVQPMA